MDYRFISLGVSDGFQLFLVRASNLPFENSHSNSGISDIRPTKTNVDIKPAQARRGNRELRRVLPLASIAISCCLSAASLFAIRQSTTDVASTGTALLILAIVSMPFTRMTAFRVEPMAVDGSFSNPGFSEDQGCAFGRPQPRVTEPVPFNFFATPERHSVRQRKQSGRHSD